MRETSGAITRYNEYELACKAYTRALSAENLQAAFRRTGIFPLNKEVIATESVIPAQVFEPEKSVDLTENDSDNDSDAKVEGGVVEETENDKDKTDYCVSGSFFQNKEDELRRIKSELA